MAYGDFLELAQRACYQARFRPDNSDDLARAKEAINEAYLTTLASGDRWSFNEKEGTFTITVAADVYSISSIATSLGVDRIAEIYSITNDSEGGQPLEGLDWYSLERISATSQDDDPTGLPTSFAVWGDRLRFNPWPDDTYEMGIICLASADQMTSDTEEPLIPLEWRHKLLVPYAAMRLMEQHSGGDAINHARYYREQYESALAQMRLRYGAARYAQIGLDGPGANDDLPGNVPEIGWWDIEY